MRKVIFAIIIAFIALASCTEKRPSVVEFPAFDTWNSTTLEISKIEMSDSATVLHIDAFFRPHNWIRIDKNTYIRESGTDNRLIVTYSEGIPLDEEYYMPESGTTSFKLFFPPLPPHVTKIDFIESDCENCFKTWGVSLIPGKKVKAESIPAEFAQSANQPLPEMTFSSQKAIISGKFLGYHDGLSYQNVTVYEPGILTGNSSEVNIQVEADGSFKGEVSVGFPSVVYTSFGNQIFVVPGKETKVYIDLKKQSRFQSKLRTDKEPEDSLFIYATNYGITPKDLVGVQTTMRNIFDFGKIMNDVSGMNPDDFRTYMINLVDTKQHEIDNSSISDNAKTYTIALLKNQTSSLLLQYEPFMNAAYMRTNNIPWEEQKNIKLNIEKPNADYFIFLKDLVNDAFVIEQGYFSNVSILLANDYFNLPKTENHSPKERFDYFKKSITPYLSSEQEILFNIAIARIYGEQIQKMEFFSDAQKEEILNSIENKALADALIAENDAMQLLVENNKTASGKDFVINEIPDVAQDKVFDAIIAKYKGKVVVVDFWATWCGPCIQAFESMKPLKEDLKGKDVVFVFLTGETSPLGNWNKKIPELHGEHYRVTDSQWSYWYEQYGIEGIPTYMIFDKDGKLISRHLGFPGVETIQGSIDKGLI